MAQQKWYLVGRKAEKDFVKRFGGTHVEDRMTQNKGIDVLYRRKDGVMISFDVKDMVRKSAETGNIIYEHTLERSRDGYTCPGWGRRGANTHFAILAKTKGRKQWLIMPRGKLEQFIAEHPHQCKERTINPQAAALNRQIGPNRCDVSHFTVIPLDNLIDWMNEQPEPDCLVLPYTKPKPKDKAQ